MLVCGLEIPDEIIIVICDFLAISELAKLQQVCRELHALGNDQQHWRNRCLRLTPDAATIEHSSDWKAQYRELSTTGFLYVRGEFMASDEMRLQLGRTRLSTIGGSWNYTVALSADRRPVSSVSVALRESAFEIKGPADGGRFEHLATGGAFYAVADSLHRVYVASLVGEQLIWQFTAPEPIVCMAASDLQVACLSPTGRVYMCARTTSAPDMRVHCLDSAPLMGGVPKRLWGGRFLTVL